MHNKIYYLDTSALVKRYIGEKGSEILDRIYSDAYRGLNIISFSYWNLGESLVVFDKYEDRVGLDARKLFFNMLRELSTLSRLGRIAIIGIRPSILWKSMALILRYHTYVADAIQIPSAKEVGCDEFVTADKKLGEMAKKEGLKTLILD